MIKMPAEYCAHCEERLATVKWYPFCDHVCTVNAINAGWVRLANGGWEKR